ncbi:MAG: hypothetical protein JW779_07945 [Candidatus Thorarchaeota archaeon]|nr:hypothetical protein [Candidatus Thorarchaeota archaeon]
MSERHSEYPHYPRRGAYGDTTQRCAWCGQLTTFEQRAYVGGAFRRNYCSYYCMAAGDFVVNTIIAVVVSIIVVGLIAWLTVYPLENPANNSNLISAILLCLGGPGLCY